MECNIQRREYNIVCFIARREETSPSLLMPIYLVKRNDDELDGVGGKLLLVGKRLWFGCEKRR
jgi:hypothetical protein